MSGIGGMMQRAGSPSDYALSLIAKSLQHRGPEATIGETYGEVGFVYTQLSITHLESGKQPIHGKNLALIANAEIYNSQEIRGQFPDYPFKTQSDCESILPLFQKYGEEFASHLRGMYALALYDDSTKTLYLTRDPFGIKPLYYWEGITGVGFASEPQALIESELLTPQLNTEKVYSLLSFNYTWGRETLFKNIHRVLPGETLVVKKGNIVKRLYRQPIPKPSKDSISLKDSLTKLDEVLDKSVQLHLASEAPIGIFLTGDIDSSYLLKLVSRHSKQPLKTFSVHLSDAEAEKTDILKLSQMFSTQHESISFDENDFWSLLPAVMEILDDPTLDGQTLPTFKVAKKAAESVKVLLSGEGSHVLFGDQRYSGFTRPWWLGGARFSNDDKLKKYKLMRHFDSFLWNDRDALALDCGKRKFTNLQTAQAIDIESFLPNDLLLKLDRCLMAFGIEGRTPFVDVNVVEASFYLPDTVKFKNKTPQWFLRNWLEQNSPEVIALSKSQEKNLPIGNWIQGKAAELGPIVARQAGVKEMCHPAKVEKIFTSNDENSKNIAWGLLCFALWHHIHILKKKPKENVIETLSQ